MRSSGVRAFFACLVVGRVFLSQSLRAKFVTTYTKMHSSNKGGKKKVSSNLLFFSLLFLFFFCLVLVRPTFAWPTLIFQSIFYHRQRISFFPNKQRLSFTLFLVSDPLCIYTTPGRDTTYQLSKHFYKKNDALLMVRKKSREEREREEALGEKRNEREKRDGTTERFCITWFSDTRRRA